MATVRVKRGRAKPLWFGHPWLFSQAIERVDPDAAAGDIVDVEDDTGRFIGRGFFHPTSQIAVRMLTRKAEIVDAPFLKARLATALELRRRLGLPSERTTAFRWVNAEGDQEHEDVHRNSIAESDVAAPMERQECRQAHGCRIRSDQGGH